MLLKSLHLANELSIACNLGGMNKRRTKALTKKQVILLETGFKDRVCVLSATFPGVVVVGKGLPI